MSDSIQITGGFRAGLMNASWPFAKLRVSAEELSVWAVALGTYTFSPGDVVALEPYGFIPVVGRGIRIVHANPRYPKRIVFWCLLESPEGLVRRIEELGFRPAASANPDC